MSASSRSSACKYHVHARQSHLAWDNSLAPIHRVKSGEEVSFDTVDASNGQITASSTVQAVHDFQMDLLDQVNGPIYVEGAEVGDVLQIDFLSVETAEWGWTAIIPEFGLLHEEFTEPALKIWKIDKETQTAAFNDYITIDTSRPFTGEAGVARGEPGQFSTIPPYRTGGNLDTRHITQGSKLFLPVEVRGALFSLGDGHAAQGDGEVCGTAIETPVKVTVRLTVRKDKPYLSSPHLLTSLTHPVPVGSDGTNDVDANGDGDANDNRNGSGNVNRIGNGGGRGRGRGRGNRAGYYATLGIAPTLEDATKQAVRALIAYLTHATASFEAPLTREQAYMLCSVVVELRVTCCVDMPHYAVGAYLPLNIFREPLPT